MPSSGDCFLAERGPLRSQVSTWFIFSLQVLRSHARYTSFRRPLDNLWNVCLFRLHLAACRFLSQAAERRWRRRSCRATTSPPHGSWNWELLGFRVVFPATLLFVVGVYCSLFVVRGVFPAKRPAWQESPNGVSSRQWVVSCQGLKSTSLDRGMQRTNICA